MTLKVAREPMPYTSGILYGTLILDIENTGMVAFPVADIEYGNPTLSIYPLSLNFTNPGPLEFNMMSGNGILEWEIKEAPLWLKFSSTNGRIDSYKGLKISLNTSLLERGKAYSGSFKIKSNAPEGEHIIPVTVSATAVN